jgi:hypothetical protein
MDEDDDLSIGTAIAVVAVHIVIAVIAMAVWVSNALIFLVDFSLARGWRWLRVSTLGGVTTLERTLSDLCVLCRDTLEAGDEVRTLSCNHVFHTSTAAATARSARTTSTNGFALRRGCPARSARRPLAPSCHGVGASSVSSSALDQFLERFFAGFFRRFCICILGTDKRVLLLV